MHHIIGRGCGASWVALRALACHYLACGSGSSSSRSRSSSGSSGSGRRLAGSRDLCGARRALNEPTIAAKDMAACDARVIQAAEAAAALQHARQRRRIPVAPVGSGPAIKVKATIMKRSFRQHNIGRAPIIAWHGAKQCRIESLYGAGLGHGSFGAEGIRRVDAAIVADAIVSAAGRFATGAAAGDFAAAITRRALAHAAHADAELDRQMLIAVRQADVSKNRRRGLACERNMTRRKAQELRGRRRDAIDKQIAHVPRRPTQSTVSARVEAF